MLYLFAFHLHFRRHEQSWDGREENNIKEHVQDAMGGETPSLRGFFALFSCIMQALEVMVNERLFAGQYGDAAWSWDTDTKNKASGLANAISSFSSIITLLTAMKCLSILKPLSVKLQKRYLDVYEAYTNSNNVTDDLQDIRDNIEDIWTEWFDLAVTTAANVGVVPSIPSRTNQQQHRDNVPAQTPSDYYKRAVAIPLLDHLQSEMKTYFNPTNDAVLSSLFKGTVSRLCARASVICFSSKDNRTVILTRQDFIPERTADGDLLFIFSSNTLDFRRSLSSYLKFGSRHEDLLRFYH